MTCECYSGHRVDVNECSSTDFFMTTNIMKLSSSYSNTYASCFKGANLTHFTVWVPLYIAVPPVMWWQSINPDFCITVGLYCIYKKRGGFNANRVMALCNSKFYTAHIFWVHQFLWVQENLQWTIGYVTDILNMEFRCLKFICWESYGFADLAIFQAPCKSGHSS